MPRRRGFVLPIGAALLVSAVAWLGAYSIAAENDHAAHKTGAAGDAAREFSAVNSKMHQAMGTPLTGDADVDFMQGMIPHHQGAVEMAEVLLKYGKDPEARKLAEAIIKAQNDEIAFIKDWIKKRSNQN